MTDIAPRRFVMVIDKNASADLVLRKAGSELYIESLFLRAFADTVPIRFLPMASLRDKKRQIKTREKVTFSPAKGLDFEIEAAEVDLDASTGAKVKLTIPFLSKDFPPYFVTIDFDRGSAEEVTLMEVRRAAYTKKSDGMNMKVWHLVASQTPESIQCITEYHDLVIGFHISWPESGQLTITSQGDWVQVKSTSLDLQRGRLCLFFHPIGGQRRIDTNPTASFVRAPLILAVYPPLMPRLMHWLACSVPTGYSFPLAIPPLCLTTYPIPYLTLGLSDWMWLTAFRLQDIPEKCVAILFGEPPVEEFHKMVRSDQYRGVLIAGENEAHVSECIAPFVPPENARNTLVVGWHAKTRVGGMTVEWRPNVIETLLLQVVSDLLVNDELLDAWNHHILHRLPPIPYVPDLSIAGVCILGNILRGRIPDDRGGSRQTGLPYCRMHSG